MHKSMEALQHARNTKDNKEMAYILSSLPAEFILEKCFISSCLLPVDIYLYHLYRRDSHPQQV